MQTIDQLEHGVHGLPNAVAIPLDQVESVAQHREHFDEDAIRRLANSLVDDGQMQPIRVRYDAARDKYPLIAGERRLRAARIAGFETIDAIVEERTLTESDILCQQIIENALREDLSPVEQGRAFVAAMKMEGIDQKRLAARLNVHPSTVSRTVRLVNLNAIDQGKVERGELAITKAIKKKDGDSAKAIPKPIREKKLKTSFGITLTLKSRKALLDSNIILALRELISTLEAAATASTVSE